MIVTAPPTTAATVPNPSKTRFMSLSSFSPLVSVRLPSFIRFFVERRKSRAGYMYIMADPITAPVKLTTTPASSSRRASPVMTEIKPPVILRRETLDTSSSASHEATARVRCVVRITLKPPGVNVTILASELKKGRSRCIYQKGKASNHTESH